MTTNRLTAQLAQSDFVIETQGGFGKLGHNIVTRIQTLQSKLASTTDAAEYQRLSHQLGECERAHKQLLEDAGQGNLLCD